MKQTKIPYLIATIIILASAITVLAFGHYINKYRVVEYKETEKVHITLNFAYQNNPWNVGIQNVVSSFESEHPDIVVDFAPQYENEVYEDSLLKKIARDELGDIVQLKTPAEYVKNGLFAPIEEKVSSLSTFFYEYEGEVYSVGAVETTWGVLYNRDYFDQYGLSEPETYEDYLEICKVLKRSGITPIAVGGDDLWHMEYWTNHFFKTDVLSKNEDWLKDCNAGAVFWTDNEPGEMLNHLLEVFKYANGDWLGTSDVSTANMLADGEVAMIYTGPWTASIVSAQNESMSIGWFFVPDSEGVPHVAVNQDTYWGVTKKCAEDPAKYRAAMEFLEYFYTCEEYGELCHKTYTFPAYVGGVPAEEMPLQKEVMTEFVQADAKYTAYIGNEDTPLGFEKNMLEIVRDILSGKCDLDEGQELLQRAWMNCKKRGTQS